MKQLQHFCHLEHLLVFNEEKIYVKYCLRCKEPILGPSYNCIECKDYKHHKSFAELLFELSQNIKQGQLRSDS